MLGTCNSNEETTSAPWTRVISYLPEVARLSGGQHAAVLSGLSEVPANSPARANEMQIDVGQIGWGGTRCTLLHAALGSSTDEHAQPAPPVGSPGRRPCGN